MTDHADRAEELNKQIILGFLTFPGIIKKKNLFVKDETEF